MTWPRGSQAPHHPLLPQWPCSMPMTHRSPNWAGVRPTPAPWPLTSPSPPSPKPSSLLPGPSGLQSQVSSAVVSNCYLLGPVWPGSGGETNMDPPDRGTGHSLGGSRSSGSCVSLGESLALSGHLPALFRGAVSALWTAAGLSVPFPSPPPGAQVIYRFSLLV